mgnify:CR=1 FL=1
MRKNGKCIVLSAPSGSGKTTIAKHLLTLESINLNFSISATSREPRGAEKKGKDYFFLSHKLFLEKAESNAFAEYEEVYPGVFYGTYHSEINRIWDQGQTVLFDIDVEGGISIKKLFPVNTLTIFKLTRINHIFDLKKYAHKNTCMISNLQSFDMKMNIERKSNHHHFDESCLGSRRQTIV